MRHTLTPRKTASPDGPIAASPPSDAALTVLVAGDDQSNRKLLSEVVRSRGHQVVDAEDARSAWDAFGASPFRLVLLDLPLPKRGNLDLCRRIRQHAGGGDVVVIVLTDEGDPDAILKTLEAGADEYLTKPVDLPLFNLRLAVAERELSRRAEYRVERQRVAVLDEEIRSLLANLDQVIFSLDPRSGHLLRVSPATRSLLGYSPDELIADESLWRALLYPPEVEFRQEELTRRVDQPVTHRWQVSLLDGSTRWVELSVKGTLDLSGVLVRVDGRLSDVSEAQRSREELAARNKELMTLYRISEVTLTASSPERAHEKILEELCKATGFPIAVIAQSDVQRERLIVTAAWGFPPDPGRLDMPIHDTLAGEAFSSGQPDSAVHRASETRNGG